MSIEAVLRACEISRGALYHHYPSKEALFEAVLEAAEARVVETVSQAAQTALNPLDGLRAGCKAWLGLATSDPVVRQIILIDAPSVIGWERWRAVDSRYGLGLLKTGLALLVERGRGSAEMIEVNAHILLAALTEVALMLARSGDREDIRRGDEAIEQVVSRLAGVAPHAVWTDPKDLAAVL